MVNFVHLLVSVKCFCLISFGGIYFCFTGSGGIIFLSLVEKLVEAINFFVFLLMAIQCDFFCFHQLQCGSGKIIVYSLINTLTDEAGYC